MECVYRYLGLLMWHAGCVECALFLRWISQARFVTCKFNWLCLRALFVTCKFYWVCLRTSRVVLWIHLGSWCDMQVLLSLFCFMDGCLFRSLYMTCKFYWGCLRTSRVLLWISLALDVTCRFCWECSVLLRVFCFTDGHLGLFSWLAGSIECVEGIFLWLADSTECVYGYLGLFHGYSGLFSWLSGFVECVLFYGWTPRALSVTCRFCWVWLRALFVTCRFSLVCLRFLGLLMDI